MAEIRHKICTKHIPEGIDMELALLYEVAEISNRLGLEGNEFRNIEKPYRPPTSTEMCFVIKYSEPHEGSEFQIAIAKMYGYVLVNRMLEMGMKEVSDQLLNVLEKL